MIQWLEYGWPIALFALGIGLLLWRSNTRCCGPRAPRRKSDGVEAENGPQQ